jgi:hypothetical protein
VIAYHHHQQPLYHPSAVHPSYHHQFQHQQHRQQYITYIIPSPFPPHPHQHHQQQLQFHPSNAITSTVDENNHLLFNHHQQPYF